jgi:DNA-binding MarR family transcriptional regulator
LHRQFFWGNLSQTTMAAPKTKKGPVRTWPQVRVFRELLRANARVLQKTREFVEAETGLSVTEFDMIIELGNQTGVRMSDLATKLVVSPANVTRVAQSLAAKGLVTRERAAHSEREVLARLTPEGNARFERYFPKAAAFMAGLMDERLSAAEQAKLAELLEKLGRPA